MGEKESNRKTLEGGRGMGEERRSMKGGKRKRPEEGTKPNKEEGGAYRERLIREKYQRRTFARRPRSPAVVRAAPVTRMAPAGVSGPRGLLGRRAECRSNLERK